MEGQIGWFRRNQLVPVPDVASFAELNAMIDQWDAEDEQRRIGERARTVGEHFAIESRCCSHCRTSRSRRAGCSPRGWTATARSRVRTNRYSVPVRLIGRQVRVLLHAS